MVSVTILLKDNKVNEKGEKPLYIRIIKGRQTKFISIGIKVHPDLWNKDKLRVKSQFPNSARVNAFIAKKLSDAECLSLDLETKHKNVSSLRIKEALIGKSSVSLINYMENDLTDIKANGKIGSYKKVKAILQKLKTYLQGKDILFHDFDLVFLKKYERYLRDDLGNSTNTIHTNLKTFRKIFNDAVREDIIEPSDNPFSKFKLSLEKTKKEYLTEDELAEIENLILKEDSKVFHHRNIYVFASYAGGVRISDLLQLKWQNYDGTHIKIITQKTKEPISIKLPTKAIELIEYYSELQQTKKKSDFIFPFLNNHTDYSSPEVLFNAIASNTAYANKDLKVIAKKAQITKHISFHSSRHTWATRALQKGMRIEYVSKLMGHGSLKTTMIYTKIVNSELDNAMDIFN